MSVWKAVLGQVKKQDGNVIATVTFSNNASPESFTQDVPGNDLTPDSLAAFCQRLCEIYEKRDESFAKFNGQQSGPVVLPRDK